MATPNEAAKKLGVSHPTVIRWVKSGKLVGQRRNSGWYVDEDSVNRLLQPAEQTDEHTPTHMVAHGEQKALIELKMQVAELEAKLGGKDELIEQLRSEITHLRRPFWRKWLDQ